MQAYYSKPYNYEEDYPPSYSYGYGGGGGAISPPPYGYGGGGGTISPPSYGYGGGGGGGGISPPWQQQYQNIYTPSPSSTQYAYGSTHHNSQMQNTSFRSSSLANCVPAFGSDPLCEIKPSAFPPGTDPKVVEVFKRIDRDGNGVVDDRELQGVLSSTCSQTFNLRTVHLLMYEFTHSSKRAIGPREFIPLLNCLKKWRTIFERFDRDRNGSIDSMELEHALNNLGYCVSPTVVSLLIAKFTKSAGRCSLQYDQFIECILTIKGLTETFKAKEDISGKATFGYEEFLLNVLPFIIA